MSRKKKKPPIVLNGREFDFSCPHQRQCRKKWFEFSKIILSAITLTYFIGLFYAIHAVDKILMDYPEYAIQALIALFGYIGTPISVSIGFYSWKAKNENTRKIEQSSGQSYSSENEE